MRNWQKLLPLLASTLLVTSPASASGESLEELNQKIPELESKRNSADEFARDCAKTDLGFALTERGEEYERRGDFKSAESDFNRAIQINPSHLAHRAQFYERQGNLKQAETDWNCLVEKDPSELWRRAEFYESQDKLELAEADLNRAVQLKVGASLYHRAKFYERQGKFGLAEADWNSYVQLDPADNLDERAGFYKRQGRYDLAEADLNRAVQLDPKGNLLWRAWFYKGQKKFELAEADLNRLVQMKNSALQERAKIYEEQGKLDLAEADLNKAVQLEPDSSIRFLNRAEFYERRGKLELAESDYNRAVEKDPQFLLIYRAEFYERQGKLDLAEADWSRAVQLGENKFDRRAHFYLRQGKLDLALRDIDKVVGVAESKLTRIQILLQMGKRELAEGAAKEFLATDKKDASQFTRYSINRAEAFLAAGKPNDALNQLRDKRNDLENSGFDALEGQLTLAVALERTGDKFGAAKAYQKSLELYAGFDNKTSSPNLPICILADNARKRLIALGGKSIAPIALAQRAKEIPLPILALSSGGGVPKEDSGTIATAQTAQDNSIGAQSSRVPSADRPIEDKWALIIGISKFRNSKYNLRFASKDALDFYNFLVNEANFKRDHVLLLLDEKATAENIKTAFGDKFLPAVAEPGDMVVVFVSTHGTPKAKDHGGRNYIVAYDTDVDKLYATGVDMDELYRRTKEAVKTDRALIVMDTCYSGAGVPGAKAMNDGANFDAKEIAQGCGHLVVTSSAPSERSWESKVSPNGVFTKYLLESLRQKNGKVDVKSAFLETQGKVSWEVKSAFSASQTPQLGGEWEGKELILSVPASKPRPFFNPEILQMMQLQAINSSPLHSPAAPSKNNKVRSGR